MGPSALKQTKGKAMLHFFSKKLKPKLSLNFQKVKSPISLLNEYDLWNIHGGLRNIHFALAFVQSQHHKSTRNHGYTKSSLFFLLRLRTGLSQQQVTIYPP